MYSPAVFFLFAQINKSLWNTFRTENLTTIIRRNVDLQKFQTENQEKYISIKNRDWSLSSPKL